MAADGSTIHAHGTTMPDSTHRLQTGDHGIGFCSRKIDGAEKATGQARYTDDIALPGMLHAKIKRSIKSHARIVSIDTKDAENLRGVHAIITGNDMPVKYGVIPWTKDEYPLCTRRV